MYKRIKNYAGRKTIDRFELLTKNELRVMKLTGQGYPTTEIATKMGIKKSTVDSYRMRTIKKLNIKRSNYRRWAFKLAADLL